MSPTTLVPEAPPSLFDDADAGPTLEDVVGDAWRALATGAEAVCPVCGGALAPRYGSGAAALGGRCRTCGSELS
jgi:uncharacterized protein (DUF983 family)